MAADRLRLAAIAADGRVDVELPHTDTNASFFDTVRRVVAAHHLHSAEREESTGVSRVVEVVALAAGARIVCALAGYALASQHASRSAIAVEWHLLMVLALGLSGAALIYGGQREARSRALGTLFVLLGSAFTPRLVLALKSVLPGDQMLGIIAFLPTEAFFGCAAWMFAAAFPAAPSGWPVQKAARAMIWTTFGIAILLAGINIVEALAPGVRGARLLTHQLTGRSGFWPILVATAAPALPVIWWKARAVSLIERTRAVRFTLALIAGLTPAVALLSGASMNPAVYEHLSTYRREYGFALYAGLLTIPLTSGYAVGSAQVLPARMAIRAALLAATTRGALLALLITPIGWLAVHATRNATLALADFVAEPGTRLAMLLSAVSALALYYQPSVASVVNRLFDRQRGTAAATLATAATSLRTAVGLREVVGAVRSGLRDAFGTSAVHVIVGNLEQDFETVDANPLTLARRSALVAVLEAEPVPLLVSGQGLSPSARRLPAAELRLLNNLEAHVVCGIPNTSGRLLGLVTVGVRDSEQAYTEADLQGIATLCAVAGIAIERLRVDEPATTGPETAAAECLSCGRVYAHSSTSCGCGGGIADARVPAVVANRYQVLRRVGAGGMGVVYEGKDLSLGRRVALKALPAVTREEAERLTTEARTMASLSHPNIALIYSLEFWRDTPILAMEFMPCGTLADAIASSPRRVRQQSAAIAAALRAAVHHIHDRGRLHRDIKPSNIGFRDEHTPVLLDFGISVQATEITAVAGTLAYLAPHVMAEERQDAASDNWAMERILNEINALEE